MKLQAQDLVWFLLFSALALASPGRSLAELEILAALFVLQLAAPRLRAFSSRSGNLAVITLKLILGFLLIGVTGGILSSYYPILLLPVVSSATTLGAAANALTTVIACLAYLAFLPWAWRLGYQLTPEAIRTVVLNVLFLPFVSYLTYELASSNRETARKAQASAAGLADANRRLLEAEASVRRAERLAALGQLTAGLAHELRNPLGTIKASSEMLAERIGDTSNLAAELAGYISSEVDRANSLVTRFLDFARPLRVKPSPADLHAVADRAISHLERENPGSTLSVHRNYDPAASSVEADAELLERVVFNLLQNAVQASSEDSPITIKTRVMDPFVELAVIDRGAGIPADIREQIFNPFFTTKASGVGLGLPISAKIVAEHGGRLTVESDLGKGSIFLMQLPLRQPSAGSPAT